MFQQRGRAYTESRTKQFHCQIQRRQHQYQQKQRQQQRFTRASTTTTTAVTATATKAGGDGTGINIYKWKLKMANTLSVMTNVLRNVVSKQRIRYRENGYNLDLAYICDNIIAMGYPAENLESIYRNRLEDTYRFLEENHPGHYKIYNLCLERSYDINKFHRRVAVYPFEDHNPPTIELILKFCGDVHAWLNADRQNVAAVHCKAGKGRTGTMICCYLLYSQMSSTAEDALSCYGEKRTKDRKGVTIPSQRRYVQYFAKLLQSKLPYEKRALQFCEIRFTEANLLHSQGTAHCSISVLEDTECGVKVQQLQILSVDFRKSNTLDLNHISLSVAGDIKVELTQKTSRKKLFHFWFNTYFVPGVADIEGSGDDEKLVYTLNKNEIDDAHKDKDHKNFPEDFKVQLVFYAGNPNRLGPANVNSQFSNHRKSQNARLPQQSSNNSSNYQLQQNSSYGSDLNCDQKSSSSASVSSLGRAGLSGGDSDDINRVCDRGRHSYGSAISNNQSSALASPVHERFLEKQHSYLDSDKHKPNRTECRAGYINDIGNDYYLQSSHFAKTSTPNQKQQQQHQQQQQQQEHQHQQHNKTVIQGDYSTELTAIQLGRQQRQQYQAAASNSKGVNRASNSTVNSNSNSNSNGSAKQKDSVVGHEVDDSVVSVGTVGGGGAGSNSSKSSSISSHSSSATADNDEEEDWESGECLAKPIDHKALQLSTPKPPNPATTSTITSTTTITHSTLIPASSDLPIKFDLSLNSNSGSCCNSETSNCDDDENPNENNVKLQTRNNLRTPHPSAANENVVFPTAAVAGEQNTHCSLATAATIREKEPALAGVLNDAPVLKPLSLQEVQAQVQTQSKSQNQSSPQSKSSVARSVEAQQLVVPSSTSRHKFMQLLRTSKTTSTNTTKKKPLFRRKSFKKPTVAVGSGTQCAGADCDTGACALGCANAGGIGGGGGVAGLATSSKQKLKMKLRKKKLELSNTFEWFPNLFRADPDDFCKNIAQQTTALRRNSGCSVGSRSHKLSTSTPPLPPPIVQVVQTDVPLSTQTSVDGHTDAEVDASETAYVNDAGEGGNGEAAIYASHAIKSCSASTTTSNASISTSGGDVCEDYYSSICDNQLSFNNSPCKSPRSLVDSLTDSTYMCYHTPLRRHDLLPGRGALSNAEAGGGGKHVLRHTDGHVNVVVIEAKPAKTHAIGFNVTNGVATGEQELPAAAPNDSKLNFTNGHVSILNDKYDDTDDTDGPATASSIYLTPPTTTSAEGEGEENGGSKPSAFVFPKILRDMSTSTSTCTDKEKLEKCLHSPMKAQMHLFEDDTDAAASREATMPPPSSPPPPPL